MFRRSDKSDAIPLTDYSETLLPASPRQSLIEEDRGRTSSNGSGFCGIRFGHGYKFGVRCCLLSVTTVFTVNLVLTIVSVARSSISGGLGTISHGKCNDIKRTDLWLHLLINILSTALLGASNYCMQCLSSPTRKEVDAAHSSRIWVDIGVPSLRNLSKISRPRLWLWLALGCSSIPLHLLYNSAIFATLSYEKYAVFAVAPDFVTGSPWDVGVLNATLATSGTKSQTFFAQIARLQADVTSLKRLENADCIAAYGTTFISDYGDLLVVLDTVPPANNSLIDMVNAMDTGTPYTGSPSDWICPDRDVRPCSPARERADAVNWEWYKTKISYCLAQQVEPRCELQFSIAIMIIVLVCNMCKGLCMAVMIWRPDWLPLITIGDAVASFIQQPDPVTLGSCIAGKGRYTTRDWRNTVTPYTSSRHRWFAGASKGRWAVTYTLCGLTILVAAGLLAMGLDAVHSTGNSGALSLGFGEISGRALISFASSNTEYDSSVVAMVLVANIPQLLLSFLYFCFNGLFTCMLLAEEWSGYAHQRKALRVSKPRGNQRSTYRLQLPYKYGLPLLIIAALLHWLVSQSIFLARVRAYDPNGQIPSPDDDISTCGYSPRAILTTLLVSILVLLIGLGFGFFRHYKPGIQLVGSCSAAISAACHTMEYEGDISMDKLMWGDVAAVNEINGRSVTGVRHCTFSAREVRMPEVGVFYAGKEGREREMEVDW